MEFNTIFQVVSEMLPRIKIAKDFKWWLDVVEQHDYCEIFILAALSLNTLIYLFIMNSGGDATQQHPGHEHPVSFDICNI